MSIESRLRDVEESLRLLRDANRLQGRRVSATAPSAADVMSWDNTNKKWVPEAPSTAVAHALDSTTHTSRTHSELSDAPADAHHARVHKDEHEQGGSDAFDTGTVLAVGILYFQGVLKGTANLVSVETRDNASGVVLLRAWNGSAQEVVAQIIAGAGSGAARFEIKQGKLTGELEANSNQITGLAAPTNDNDAARQIDLYTDSEAVTAVPYRFYLSFGSDPLFGDTFAP